MKNAKLVENLLPRSRLTESAKRKFLHFYFSFPYKTKQKTFHLFLHWTNKTFGKSFSKFIFDNWKVFHFAVLTLFPLPRNPTSNPSDPFSSSFLRCLLWESFPEDTQTFKCFLLFTKKLSVWLYFFFLSSSLSLCLFTSQVHFFSIGQWKHKTLENLLTCIPRPSQHFRIWLWTKSLMCYDPIPLSLPTRLLSWSSFLYHFSKFSQKMIVEMCLPLPIHVYHLFCVVHLRLPFTGRCIGKKCWIAQISGWCFQLIRARHETFCT